MEFQSHTDWAKQQRQALAADTNGIWLSRDNHEELWGRSDDEVVDFMCSPAIYLQELRAILQQVMHNCGWSAFKTYRPLVSLIHKHQGLKPRSSISMAFKLKPNTNNTKG